MFDVFSDLLSVTKRDFFPNRDIICEKSKIIVRSCNEFTNIYTDLITDKVIRQFASFIIICLLRTVHNTHACTHTHTH